jgi:16S rRNA (guanine(966)-N(2))-methyltransferase RsmD
MRITGGDLKGWVIPSKFASHVRPSTDRMRESLFNTLMHQFGIEEKKVLDLFSGSGVIAAEFLSRGAESVISVDMDYKNIEHQKLMKQMRNLENWNIVKSDVFKYVPQEKFDIVFADPPYHIANIQQLPSMANDWLTDDGILILEHKPQIQFHEESLLKKEYGSTSCTIFAKKNLSK